MMKNENIISHNDIDRCRLVRLKKENPDLPEQRIKDILEGLKEAEAGKVTPYEFRSDN